MSSKSNHHTYISKVVLENFLSFQKDEVDFEDKRFIIIVGPNWSGKTSIFQAIKFALGSNERDERYKKWSDFIRHGQDHAMVEIHINNNDEVVKIRRIVVRGKSPYFMIQRENDKKFGKITASEIQELIEKFNINPDNQFAFVSQGKIDSIKNLKSTTLCLFLEEGIGLKGLREEILQQKKSVQELNEELNTLITKKNTLNVSLELLTPKLERLKEKKRLEKVKKTYDDELLWANRQQIKLEIVDLIEDIREVQKKINDLKTEKQKHDEKIEKFQALIDEIQEEINNLMEKNGENKQQKKELIQQIKSWQQQKVQMKKSIEVLAEKIKRKEKIVDNLSEQKKSLGKEVRIVKTKITNYQKKIDKLWEEYNTLENKIKKNKTFLEKYDKILARKEEKLEEIEKNREVTRKYHDEIKQIFLSLEDIEHKLEQNKWFMEDPTNNLLKDLDLRLREITTKQNELEYNRDELERERSKKFHNLKRIQQSLRNRKINLPTNITILKDEIQKIPSLQSVKGPIIEYLKYDDKLSYAIESVLGERLLYSFVADSWDSMELLKRLKNKYKAYCNIYLPKNSMKVSTFLDINAPGVVGYLAHLIRVINDDLDIKKVLFSKIRNCLVVEKYHLGRTIYRNHNFKGKIVTLDGEQIVSYKYAYETPFMKRLKGLLSAGTQQEQAKILETELKELNEKLAQNKVTLSHLDEEKRDLYRKKESFHDLKYHFKQRQRLTDKKNDLYQKRNNLERINSTINDDITDLEVEIKELEDQKDPEFFKWTKRIKQIPDEQRELNKEKKRWDTELQENQEILNEINEKLGNAENEMAVLIQQHRQKEEEFKNSDKNAFETYKQLDIIEDKIAELEGNIGRLREKIAQINEERKSFDKESMQIHLQLEQYNTALNGKNQDLSQKQNDLERIENKLGPLISENKFKIRPVEEIKGDIFAIEKEILKYYDVDDSLLVEKDRILSDLKKIVKNQKDLENDIKAAMKAENKMESTYYDKFKLVLDDLEAKINKKFQQTKINCYCSLQLEGDFNELGVEIQAATSKDMLKSCTALSGGQVSMVVICLILSLQEIQPSPLCMFDEAGMFLDDKNSEAAYQLIKSTLEQNPIQMMMFLPQSSNSLFLLAEKLVGVARSGRNETSTIFNPKILEKN